MMFSTPLERLARLCSILGGLVMTGLMLMTCYSLIGRNFLDSALIGDFELTGVGAGAAIALFMPLCQFKRENIIVDFFTSKCSEATNFKLDRLGDLFMTLIFFLLSWRCAAAAIRRASAESRPSGFSHTTCLPASRAWTTHSAC